MNALQLLAIETSSARGSVAVGCDGTVLERTIATPREQTDRVLACIDELLEEAEIALADLDAVVFGRGPGSFTGLRVAAAVTQGLGLATGVPIVSVSSLAALAQAGFESCASNSVNPSAAHQPAPGADSIRRAVCCIDARMGEVYSAAFEWSDGLAVSRSEEWIGKPGALELLPKPPFMALGDGFDAYAQVLAGAIDSAAVVDAAVSPGARQLLTLAATEVAAGRFLSPEAALPVYLRGADAWRRIP